MTRVKVAAVSVALFAAAVVAQEQSALDQAKAKAEQIKVLADEILALEDTPPPPPPPPPSSDSVCGEDPRVWHAQIVTINGALCDTGHEHGHAPPDWVTGSAFAPRLLSGGSEAHRGFKGALLSAKNQSTGETTGAEVYVLFHIFQTASVESELGGPLRGGINVRRHSYQMWARTSPPRRLLYVSGMMDTAQDAQPDLQRISKCRINDPGIADIRPVIFVPVPGCPDTNEQWYSHHRWADNSFLILGTPWRADLGDGRVGSASLAELSGRPGTQRRIDVATYLDRFTGVPRDTVVCADMDGALGDCADPLYQFKQYLETGTDRLFVDDGFGNRKLFAELIDVEFAESPGTIQLPN